MPSKYGFQTIDDKKKLMDKLINRGTEIGHSIKTEVQDLLSDLAQAQNWHEDVYNDADHPRISFYPFDEPDGRGRFCSWWITTKNESKTVRITLVCYSRIFCLEVEGWGAPVKQFCILCENLSRLTTLDVSLDYGVGEFKKYWGIDLKKYWEIRYKD